MKAKLREMLWSPWFVMSVVGVVYVIKFGFKMGIGQWVNSPALIADAFHNLSDLVEVGLVMFFGIYLGGKPKTAEYPMGRKRIESLLVLGVGLALSALTYATVMKSLSGFLALWPAADAAIRPLAPSWLLPEIKTPMITLSAFGGVLFATGISALMSVFVGRYQIKVGKRAGTASVVADGEETLSDGRIEIAAFIGFLTKFGLVFALGNLYPEPAKLVGGLIEYGLGLGVAYLVFRTARELMGHALSVLLAKSIGEEKVTKIKSLALEIPGIRTVPDITTFSDGHTATCLITVETAGSSKAHRPLRRALKKRIIAFLRTFEQYLGQEVHVNFSRPEPAFTREVQAIIRDNDGNEMNAPTLLDATHLRIYDLDGEENRLRAVDVCVSGKNLSQIIDLLVYKTAKTVSVFIGTNEERHAVENAKIRYELSHFIKVYVPSRIRGATL